MDRKQEMIHSHGLLAEIRKYFEQKGYELDLEEYEDLDMRPTSIHKSKTDHKEAVFALTEALSDPILVPVSASPDALRDGTLQSRSENEHLLADTLANVAAASPETVARFAPVLISLIKNGNTATQRRAIAALEDIATHSPSVVGEIQNELRWASNSIHERNVQQRLRRLLKPLDQENMSDGEGE